jgi:pyruvate,water dikinase
MEFLVSNVIRAHPLALLNYDSLPEDETKESHRALTGLREQGRLLRRHARPRPRADRGGLVSQPGHRADVGLQDQRICRASGRARFEPKEENPMIGLRGASRYYSDFYRDAFALECGAEIPARGDGLRQRHRHDPVLPLARGGRPVLEVMADTGWSAARTACNSMSCARSPRT